MIPYSGQSVGVDTNIWFEVFDDGYDVDITSLNLSMDGNPIIVNGEVQSPTQINYQAYAPLSGAYYVKRVTSNVKLTAYPLTQPN